MANDQRVYSDEEFALILRKAAELPGRLEATPSPDGLTLAEMKAAAAQAGLDPELVERAARMPPARVAESPLERLIGGPLRHEHTARFPGQLNEGRAAQLLSAVRISSSVAGSRDAGHSSAQGMTWHDGGELESLGVTARAEDGGTTVSVTLDRRGTLGVVAAMSGMAMFMTTLFGVFGVYPDAPALGVATAVGGIGGVLALARGYWASSTRRVQERIGGVMDTVQKVLRESRLPQLETDHAVVVDALDQKSATGQEKANPSVESLRDE